MYRPRSRPRPRLFQARIDRCRPALTAAALLALAATATAAQKPAASARPNIIVIMADDMGFSDAGCYGGEIRTPNLDRLAKGGLRFTQFYNNARCCPTRASLMTGQYPHKVGLAKNGQSLTRNGLTMAEALKNAGYNTAMAGKWHLSATQPLPDRQQHQAWLDHRHDPGVPFAPLATYPARRGFDRHYGNIWGVVNYFDPFSLVDGTEPVKEVPKDYYITDAISRKAVEYVRDFSRSEKPFFLYVAHCAPHWPLHARPEDIARYKDTYREGWNALRRARYERQVQLGLVDPETTPLPPVMGRNPDWDTLTAEEREFQSAKMAVHAAMVDRMDQGIGDLLKALEETGELRNTVLFFLSDNGASPEIMTGPGYDRTSRTRDGRVVRYRGFTDPGGETTYAGIGPRWANAANTPFRYWKAESFEGGAHTPLIVHWPAGLKTKPGGTTDQTGHVIDLLPTALDLARAPYPSEYAGHRLTPLDGKSLLPILHGRRREPHDALFFEHEGGKAVRAGEWKLVAPKAGGAWELYHLKRDRTETRNLAAEQPERVRELDARWQDWARRVRAIPPMNRPVREKRERSGAADLHGQ